MDALVADDLWAATEPLLPSGLEKPKGGRLWASGRAALVGYRSFARACSGSIYRILKSAAAARRVGDGWARGRQPASGPPRSACCWSSFRLPPRSNGHARPSTTQAELRKRGCATGPNPMDRGQPGTKRNLVVDAKGTLPGLTPTEANCHDSRMPAATLDAVPGVPTGRRGCAWRRPDRLHAGKGYDHRRCRGVSAERAASRRTSPCTSLLRRSPVSADASIISQHISTLDVP